MVGRDMVTSFSLERVLVPFLGAVVLIST